MPNDTDPTAEDIYESLLKRIREMGANQLADSIESTVARGVVDVEQAGKLKYGEHRSMSPGERLATALEMLVAALEVPHQLQAARTELHAQKIKWDTGDEATANSIAPPNFPVEAPPVDTLKQIAKLMVDLNLSVPDIA